MTDAWYVSSLFALWKMCRELWQKWVVAEVLIHWRQCMLHDPPTTACIFLTTSTSLDFTARPSHLIFKLWHIQAHGGSFRYLSWIRGGIAIIRFRNYHQSLLFAGASLFGSKYRLRHLLKICKYMIINFLNDYIEKFSFNY